MAKRELPDIDNFLKDHEKNVRDLIVKFRIQAKAEADDEHLYAINTLKAEKASIQEQNEKEKKEMAMKIETLTQTGATLQNKLRVMVTEGREAINKVVEEKLQIVRDQFTAEQTSREAKIKEQYVAEQKTREENFKKTFQESASKFQLEVDETIGKMNAEIEKLTEKNKLLAAENENLKQSKTSNPSNPSNALEEELKKQNAALKNEIGSKNQIIMKLQELARNNSGQNSPSNEVSALKAEILRLKLIVEQRMPMVDQTQGITILSPKDSEYKDSLVNVDESVPIAEGGNGIIYRGLIAGCECVVKKPKSAIDDKVMEEIRNEVMLSLKYPHPNLIRIFGMMQNGMIVMEKLEFTLEKVINVLSSSNESIPNYNIHEMFGPFPNRIRAIYGILCGIEHMHAMNVVNSDIKPSNVMFDTNGKAKLIDFGLAKQKKNESANTVNATINSGGAFAGTLPYMAPEQFESDTIPYTKSADIFALGITMLSFLILEKPFDGLSANMSNLFGAMRYRFTNPVPSEEKINKIIYAPVRNIVKSTLAKKPEDRPTANTLRVSIGNYLSSLVQK